MSKKITKKPTIEITAFSLKDTVPHGKTSYITVKNKKLGQSSRIWMKRQLNDEYTIRARACGYRARSAFKLIEINDKFDIFNLGSRHLSQSMPKANTVLDLGAAPGGWTQVLVEKLKPKILVALDLLEIEPIEGAAIIQNDFTSVDGKNEILQYAHEFDLILSDIAPNTTGDESVDNLKLSYILEQEWAFVQHFLAKGGCFVSKIFMGGSELEVISELKQNFKSVKYFKPKSSRKESKEIYVICLNFLKIDANTDA